MAAEKFSFFISFYDALNELPPEEFKKVIIAICEYAFFDKEPNLPKTLLVPFKLIKPVIDKTLRISEIRSEQGKKGGAPIGNRNASKQVILSKNKQNKQIQADKDKDMDMDMDTGDGVESNNNYSNHSSISEKKESFHKPTLMELRAYCSEQHYSVNPEAFFDYYESNGWKVGRSPMKDWKAALRNWERNERHTEKSSKNSFSQCMMTNQYSKEDFSKLEEQLVEN